MALESEEFARKLRELRDAHGLSKEEAARKVGISLRQYNRWESAKAEPRPSSLRLVAGAYDMEVAELVEAVVRKNGDLSGRLERLEADLAELLGIVKDELVPSLAALEAARDAAEKGRSGEPSGKPRRSNGKT